MNPASPLGQFAPLGALIGSLSVLIGYVIALAVNDQTAATGLHDFALIALGVLIGVPALVAGSGAQAGATAANARLDAIGAPPASSAATTNGTSHPNGGGSPS